MTPAILRAVPRLVLLLLALCAGAAWADGTLTHLSGPVSVKKPDGQTAPGGIGTQVRVGDTVITGAGGFARLEMTDGGEMVLRPDSQLRVESYAFSQAKPAEDNLVFSMLKGGLRTVTGLIGKRGNKDAYELKTQTATIGIRGTQFDLRVCQANCGALADGTYLAVRFGAVQTTNAQGSLAVAAGQVAHVPPQRPPVMLPRDPGIGFTPPAVIPKLDEKKKVQAAATAAAANTPGQAKPAAGGAGPAGQTTSGSAKTTAGSSAAGATDGAGKSDSAGKPEGAGKSEGSGGGTNTGSKDGGGADAGGKAGGQESSGSSAAPQQAMQGTQTASTTPSASPTSQSGAGPECSVQ